MKCKQCSCNLAKSAKFCPECGAPAPKEEPKQQVKKEFPPILTIKQAAEFLNISRCTMYLVMKSENLPCFPIGGRKMFIRDELMNWCKNRQLKGGIGA